MTNLIFAGSHHAGVSRIARIIRTAGAGDHARSAVLSAINGDLGQRQWVGGVPAAPELRDRAGEALRGGAGGLDLWADERTAAALDFWAGVDSEARFLLIFVPPEVELAAFIVDREEPARSAELDELLQRWSETTLTMLSLLGRQPACQQSSALMINGRSALLAPRTLVSKLNRAWELDLQQPDGPQDEDRSGPGDQVAQALCRAWIEDHHPGASAIAAEARVRAMDLIPADIEPAPAVGLAVLRQVQRLSAQLREQQGHIDSASREQNALRTSLERTTAQRDDHAARLATVSDERRLALRFIGQLEDEVKRLHRNVAQRERQARDLAARQNKRASIDLVGQLRSLQR